MEIFEKFRKHRLLLVGLAAILPYLFFMITLVIYRLEFRTHLANMALRLAADWEIRWGDAPRSDTGLPAWISQDSTSRQWQPMIWPRMFIEKQNSDFAWLRTPMPDRKFTDPVLLMWGSMQEFECYIGEQLIYQSQDLDSLSAAVSAGGKVNKHIFAKWHIIPIPDDYQNQYLYLRFYSTHTDRIGILFNSIFLGR